MSRFNPASLAALAAGLAALGCGVVTEVNCTDELGMDVRPVDPIVRPGQAVVATIELTTCGGRKRWRPTVVWRAADTLVVTVDSITGRVTGRAIGATQVTPFERRADGGESWYTPVRVRVEP